MHFDSRTGRPIRLRSELRPSLGAPQDRSLRWHPYRQVVTDHRQLDRTCGQWLRSCFCTSFYDLLSPVKLRSDGPDDNKFNLRVAMNADETTVLCPLCITESCLRWELNTLIN